VQRGILIHRVEPIYPPEAERQGIEGNVRLRVTVGPDGVVRFVQLLSGPPTLAQAAIEAVRQWRFSPTLLDGKPIEATGNVTLAFHLTYPRNDQDSLR
jgi:TonB family protein